MKITFLNTPFYLIPQDETKTSIPNGYKLTINLPPQIPIIKGIVEIDAADARTTLVTIIASNSWLAYFFNVSM